MQFKGFVREIDSVGRVVIPKQLRNEFDLTEINSRVVISSENGSIVMRKAISNCTFCKSETDLKDYSGQHICASCLSQIKQIR